MKKSKFIKLFLVIATVLVVGLYVHYHYINLDKVTNYVITQDGILLHTSDGQGYYLEVPQGINN